LSGKAFLAAGQVQLDAKSGIRRTSAFVSTVGNDAAEKAADWRGQK
jgi:hypothetical protein